MEKRSSNDHDRKSNSDDLRHTIFIQSSDSSRVSINSKGKTDNEHNPNDDRINRAHLYEFGNCTCVGYEKGDRKDTQS